VGQRAKGKKREKTYENDRHASYSLRAMLFALCLPADAQHPKKGPRIGYLSSFDPARESTRAEAIRLRMDST
jgi:hypothetical protein